jgi:predicted transcriptional regulator
MRDVTPRDPFRSDPDPLPHFAPFFLDEGLRERWELTNARRAETGKVFAPPNVGFHHNPMESGVSYLYVVESPNHPGEVKIGMTDRARPEDRVREARRDSAFRKDPDARLVGYVMMKNIRARQVETATHKILGSRNSQTGTEREWFELGADQAMSAIELAARHYQDPDKIAAFEMLVRQGEDPSVIPVLNEIRPDLVSEEVRFREPDTDADLPDTGLVRMMKERSFFSAYRTQDNAEETVAFLPIIPAPTFYLWDNAGALLAQRSKLLGKEWPDALRLSQEGKLAHFDVSEPADAPFVRSRLVPARLHADGRIELPVSRSAHQNLDQDRPYFFETDLVRSEVMREISNAYWSIRAEIKDRLPAMPGVHRGERDLYLHAMTSFVIACKPEDLTPRDAQVFHSAASRIAGTPIDLGVCPVALCETAAPILRAARDATIEREAAEPDASSLPEPA